MYSSTRRIRLRVESAQPTHLDVETAILSPLPVGRIGQTPDVVYNIQDRGGVLTNSPPTMQSAIIPYRSPQTVRKHFTAHAAHARPVNTLAISPDSRYFVSGGGQTFSMLSISSGNSFGAGSEGDDGRVVLWDLTAKREIRSRGLHGHGPVVSSCWVSPKVVAVGSADSTIHMFQVLAGVDLLHLTSTLTTPFSGPVQSIDCIKDSRNEVLVAACGEGGSLGLWVLESNLSTRLLPTPGSASSYTPRLLKFLDRGKFVLVCYLESRDVKLFQARPWSLHSCNNAQTRIGHAAVSPDERHLLVSNLVDGIDLYALPAVTPIRTIKQNLGVNSIFHVGFISGTSLAYCGGDRGCVNIIDITTGFTIDTVPRRKKEVQVVASHSSERGALIVNACVDNGDAGHSSLYIWELQWSSLIQHKQDPSAALWLTIALRFTALLLALYVTWYTVIVIFPSELRTVRVIFTGSSTIEMHDAGVDSKDTSSPLDVVALINA
ncbi:hypothetical protein NM688_g2835 [Phlebia brevispora]|uniref:Uncharacterized protein n=1 Tax=Phlebia brevispora TaxID=194682 RepID=A0ACC1T7L0_9APHY|nr:hypothetical protein NM688_g2835 [Phlebia brevispora]